MRVVRISRMWEARAEFLQKAWIYKKGIVDLCFALNSKSRLN